MHLKMTNPMRQRGWFMPLLRQCKTRAIKNQFWSTKVQVLESFSINNDLYDNACQTGTGRIPDSNITKLKNKKATHPEVFKSRGPT